MKKMFICGALVSVFLFTVSAQQENYTKSTAQQQREAISTEPVQDAVPISEINEGSGGYAYCFYYGDPSGMFLKQEWMPGKAVLVDGKTMEGNFRYNLYLQKMEAVIDADTFAFAKPCELDNLFIGDSKFIYSSFTRGDYEVASSWFEVLCEGNCSLLLRRYIKYRVSDDDDDPSNDQMYRIEEYYTMHEGGSLERLFVSKKNVLEALQDHQHELRDFIKSKKLKAKEHSDLIKIFAYYNTLH
ncbi:MAG: hypothetical protein ABFS05_07475 [Bacteroidota bacterium]